MIALGGHYKYVANLPIRHFYNIVDSENNDFRLFLTNENLHALCGTREVSEYTSFQLRNLLFSVSSIIE